MTDSPADAPGWAVWLALLLVLGGAVRLPGLSAPLLEGAAGKQTHTAMVARNLYRGQATWMRPRVDDVGKPGYFVKELPVVPAIAAALYGASGAVDERFLRGIGLLAWLAATPLLTGLLRGAIGGRAALLAGLWFLISPMGIVYSRAAMNDPLAVVVSLAALAALHRWRSSPTPANVGLSAAGVAAAFLLKPHTAFWLGPAAAWLSLAPSEEGDPPRSPRALAGLVAGAAISLGLASLWYAHAAAIHRVHPVPGATVPEGWVAPSLLGDPTLYREIARQTLFMVFTPIGAALAVLGLVRGPRLRRIEWALLLWGGGVVLQCLVFAPRMFDDLSRGTEYYQLALVPSAALLVGRGLEALARWAQTSGWARPGVVLAGTIVVLGAAALVQADAAARPPDQYKTLIPDCAQVQRLTRPTDEFVVLADRGGTVLNYCDRKGHTFSLTAAVNATIVATSEPASRVELSRALGAARYLYVPFPELFAKQTDLLDELADHWHEVPLPGSKARLFAHPDTEPYGRGR